jgi:hypothetical protein
MRPEVALELVGLPPFFGTYIGSRPKGTRKNYLPGDPQKYGVSERRLDLSLSPATDTDVERNGVMDD